MAVSQHLFQYPQVSCNIRFDSRGIPIESVGSHCPHPHSVLCSMLKNWLTFVSVVEICHYCYYYYYYYHHHHHHHYYYYYHYDYYFWFMFN